MMPIDRVDPATGRRLTFGECLMLADPAHLTRGEYRTLQERRRWDAEHPTEAAEAEAMVGRVVRLRKAMTTIQATAEAETNMGRRKAGWSSVEAGVPFRVVARVRDRLIAVREPFSRMDRVHYLLRMDWVE
jgi:hypothetical protein